MKADRIVRSAASVLGAVTFAMSLAVTGPVAPQMPDTASPNIVWIASQPARKGAPAASLAPDGTTFGSAHAYSPADLYAAYNIGALHAEGITGAGQTIVVVDAYGSPTALEDLKVFSQAFGLPEPDLTIVYPNGKPTPNNTAKLDGWAFETSLDLQWAHAIAPDAKLVLIVPHPIGNLFKGVSYAVEHYPGSAISQSWCDFEWNFNAPWGDVQLPKIHQVYQQAAAVRCTVLSASGDWGTANAMAQGVPTVCYPASDPLVTGVGGTWLQYGWRWDPLISATTLAASGDLDSYLSWVDAPGGRTEAVWKEDWIPALGGPVGATGGGLSALFATPDFQQGLPQSLLQGHRGVPDISCNAATDGGVLVHFQGFFPEPFPLPASWYIIGGTSAATPELAGMVALANQLRSQMGKQPIGYLNPVLYTLPARDFDDIVPQTFGEGPGVTTLDDNSYFGSAVPGFKTTAGYDLTTGLGSPNAYWFVHDLADTP